METKGDVNIIQIPTGTAITTELIRAHEFLYRELDPENPPKILNLQDALNDANTAMLVACDGRPPFYNEWHNYPCERYVGALTLTIAQTAMRAVARIEHIAVAPDWQRRGIGGRLVQEACVLAQGREAHRVDLTSSSRRAGAQALYASLGFYRRETENWRLALKDGF